MSRTKKTVLPHYELLYIISNKYTENEVAPVAEKVKKIITKSKGEITYTEDWGKKKLAYPINHFNHGYYFLIEFDLLGKELKEVDTEIKHMTEILRHQIVKKTKRSLEEIENEKRILEKQTKRALEKKNQLEKDETKPLNEQKKNISSSSKREVIAEAKKEKEEKTDSPLKKAEKKSPKTKEEVQLNLDKLDEKLDKILDTKDLL